MSAPDRTQDFGNHARYVPAFHFFAGTVVLVILGWALYRLATFRTADAFFNALVAVVLVVQFWYVRAFPLAVQDRVICLEERLRIAKLLPSDLQAACEALTADQLVALRFASDDELPGLVRKVLDERIGDRRAIKSLIVNWRADHMRA